MKYGLIALCLGLLLLNALPAQAFCFEAAGARYRIDPRLLKAIAMQESGLNARAINVNRDKKGRALSTDYGVMQINSVHIPGLIRMGIIKHPEELLTNPCLNVQTGAWILAKHLQVCGVNWGCLGSYNAGLADNKRQDARRMQYAHRVYDIYIKMVRGDV